MATKPVNVYVEARTKVTIFSALVVGFGLHVDWSNFSIHSRSVQLNRRKRKQSREDVTHHYYSYLRKKIQIENETIVTAITASYLFLVFSSSTDLALKLNQPHN